MLEGARAVSEAFGTEHHELLLSVADAGIDLEQLIWHLDEPLADLSSLGLLELCRTAAGEIDAAFSGQGSDQLFAGYTKHCPSKNPHQAEQTCTKRFRPRIAADSARFR